MTPTPTNPSPSTVSNIDPTDATNNAANHSPTTPDDQAGDSEQLVPVSEAIRYRKRAQVAEKQLAELQAALSSAKSDLAESRTTVETLERRTKIDELLQEAKASDLGVARLLTEMIVRDMAEQGEDAGPSADPDIAAAVRELRRSKPYLFAQSARSNLMAPNPVTTSGTDVEQAAAQAAETGDRRDLLRYLRLRRRA